MAAHTGSLGERAKTLLKAHPEIALVAAFEIGRIAAAIARRREPLARALWHGVVEADARTGATAALTGMLLSLILATPPRPNGTRRRSPARAARRIPAR